MFPSDVRTLRTTPRGREPHVSALGAGMRNEVRSHTRLAALADRQHGVVSTDQLLALGYSAAAISRATAGGRLHRIHRGVYAVGRASLSPYGRCRAAVGTCGSAALLGHSSAAWLWGLLPILAEPIEVVTPRASHPRSSLRIHRCRSLADEDRAEEAGIPVTSIPCALLDLAATGSVWQLRQAIEKAERLDRLDLAGIDSLLRRRFQPRGRPRLLEALKIYRDPAFSRARSERLFLALVKEAGLPRPALNTFVAGYEIDAYWERERFAVEVDGWDAHRSRLAFEADPLRQENLKLAGIDSIRVTARRIERQPEQVAVSLAALLARRRAELEI